MAHFEHSPYVLLFNITDPNTALHLASFLSFIYIFFLFPVLFFFSFTPVTCWHLLTIVLSPYSLYVLTTFGLGSLLIQRYTHVITTHSTIMDYLIHLFMSTAYITYGHIETFGDTLPHPPHARHLLCSYWGPVWLHLFSSRV